MSRSSDPSLSIGHWPTALAAFALFFVACMEWVLLGGLGNILAHRFGLGDQEKSLLVAAPILGGALLRIPVGVCADRFGCKLTSLALLVLSALPLLAGWLWASSFPQLIIVGLLLGIAGSSFAVALPLAGRWFPPTRQGLVLGIAGSGNAGTLVTAALAPWLAEALGWKPVFALALIPLAIALGIVAVAAKEPPQGPSKKPVGDFAGLLARPEAYRLCYYYAVTFGGFMGLTSYLAIFFHDQYQVDRVRAGLLAMVCAIGGSILRPLGGRLADRCGGPRVMIVLLGVIAFTLACLSTLPPLWLAGLGFTVLMSAFGLGNGAVFQIVPQEFPGEVGAITGLVGAAGGIGGFCLPLVLGILRQQTTSFRPGLFLLALIAAGALVVLVRAIKSQTNDSTEALAGLHAEPAGQS